MPAGPTRLAPTPSERPFSPDLIRKLISTWFGPAQARSQKKPRHKKTYKQNIFMGLSRGYPGTVPAFSREFLGILLICFPFPPKKKRQHINIFDPPPIFGTIPKTCLCLLTLLFFFSPPKRGFRSELGPNQVIGSESGLGGGVRKGSGPEG